MAKHPLLEDIAKAIAPGLKERGFTKSKLVWQRHHGAVTQVIALREVAGGEISVEVGLVFDAISKLKPDEDGSSVIGGVTSHFSTSIAELARSAPKRFTAETRDVVAAVSKAVTKATAVLDRIDDAAHALDELSLERGFDKVVRAQLAWVTGDKKAALADLKRVAAEFSTRRGVSVPELERRYLRRRA